MNRPVVHQCTPYQPPAASTTAITAPTRASLRLTADVLGFAGAGALATAGNAAGGVSVPPAASPTSSGGAGLLTWERNPLSSSDCRYMAVPVRILATLVLDRTVRSIYVARTGQCQY